MYAGIHKICEGTFGLCWSDHLDVDDDGLSIYIAMTLSRPQVHTPNLL